MNPTRDNSRSEPVSGKNVPAKKILVVGDWVVDENWLTGTHRNTTSSRVSEDYCRVLNDASSNMKSLCGAGLVASILREHNFDVFGLGLWHRDDTATLERMLDPGFTERKTHHRLAHAANMGPVRDAQTPERLFCLNEWLDEEKHDFFIGTTRVIRIYELSRGKPKLKQRIDWDVQIEKKHLDTIREGARGVLNRLPGEFDFIVVKDLIKGVLCDHLVKLLVQRYPRAKWYVSSKVWQPKWISAVKPNLACHLVPQVAAQLAIGDPDSKVDRWVTHAGVPSQEALEYLKSNYSDKHVVILPSDSRVLAFDGTNRGYVQSATLPSDSHALTQMASVFLPAFMANEIRDNTRPENFRRALQEGLAYTEQWRLHDQGRITEPKWRAKRFKPDEDSRGDNSRWHDFSLDDVIGDWQDATKKLGTVRDEFHLWRGMTELKGYVSCIPEKRKHIQQLLRDGHKFVSRIPRERKHQSYIIVDQPGSGKSFLIDRLASALSMRVLKFTLTQLNGLHDLLACFDKIRSEQEHYKDVPLMVFFDEINSKPIDGSHYYYANFLEPMDDGVYLHNGIAHRLQPCFWVFAGTVATPSNVTASTKWPDFESRLTRKPMNLSGDRTRSDVLRQVERVYMGVSAIRSLFSDVTEISEHVLWVFAHLRDEVGPRDIARIVRNCENVQYGRIGLEQLPPDIRTHVYSNSTTELEDKRNAEERLVKIVDEPDFSSTLQGASAKTMLPAQGRLEGQELAKQVAGAVAELAYSASQNSPPA